MKPSRRVEQMQETLEKLIDHRRRAAAVAALLVYCDVESMKADVLSEAAGIIVDEMQGIRQCTEELYREAGR